MLKGKIVGILDLKTGRIKEIFSDPTSPPDPPTPVPAVLDELKKVRELAETLSSIQVVPVKGRVSGTVKNDKYPYPHPYYFKLLDACGLVVFTLNAKLTASKVRGMYMMTLDTGAYIKPVNLSPGKQVTINEKIAAAVPSDISFSILVPHGGYVEYDVSVEGKLLTVRT